MFQRICKQAISSNQCIAKFPNIADIKHFSSSITYFKKESKGQYATVFPFVIYKNRMYPRLKGEHPSLTHNQIMQAASQEWQQLSKEEKDKYKDIYKDEIDAWRADDDTIKEIEKLRDEIAELVQDRPTRYLNLKNYIYFNAAAIQRKYGKKNSLENFITEYKSMNESERNVYQKKFEETRQDFEKWKQKVEKDGRAEVIKNVNSVLGEKLKSLEFDKPKRIYPFNVFMKKEKGDMKEVGKKWKSLNATEREPFYEPINKYNRELPVWKEKTRQDGRYRNIEAVKKLIAKLRM